MSFLVGNKTTYPLLKRLIQLFSLDSEGLEEQALKKVLIRIERRSFQFNIILLSLGMLHNVLESFH